MRLRLLAKPLNIFNACNFKIVFVSWVMRVILATKNLRGEIFNA